MCIRDRYGVVEAVGDGTAIISVISEDGGHEAESTVNVIPAAGENDPLEVSFHEPFALERDVPINTGITIIFNKNIVPDSNYDQITLKNIREPWWMLPCWLADSNYDQITLKNIRCV